MDKATKTATDPGQDTRPGGLIFPHWLKHDIFGPHERGQPAASVIVTKKGRLAYVPVPKNASTSLKMFFFALLNDQDVGKVTSKIHRSFRQNAINFTRFAEDREHFKFLVVRDPLDRFVSAYNNRVRGHGELSEAWIRNNARHELPRFRKRGLAFDPDLNEFASRLEDYMWASAKILHHFIGQRLFFHAAPEVFDKVYNVGQLAALSDDLAARLEQPVVFPRAQESTGVTAPARAGDLAPKELARVLDYYAADYEVLKPYL